MFSINVINKVTDKGLCTGCGICASVFPQQIKMDFSGDYNRPIFNANLNTHEKKLFSHICPGVNQSSPNLESGHDIWGAYKRSYTGHSTDKNIRFMASSGGVISQTLIYLLNSNLIDAVIQVKASSIDPLDNEVVVNRKASEILESSGSRYSPASPLLNIKQTIKNNPGIRLCFVGKPCDVTALTNLMGIDDDVRASIKYRISFFCAGTPSRTGVKQLISSLGVKNEEVKSFAFRGKGWPGKTIAVTEIKTAEMTYAESWGNILGPTIQNRCKICADGIGECADIVSADVWHSDASGYPLFTENDGQGLVLPRTDKGSSLVEQMIKDGALLVSDYEIDKLKDVQPTQFERKGTVLARSFAKFLIQGVYPRYKNQRLIRAAFKVGFKKNIRSFVGSLIRASKGKI